MTGHNGSPSRISLHIAFSRFNAAAVSIGLVYIIAPTKLLQETLMDPKIPSITTLTGPPYLGIILNWGLFGALSIQVYLYCQVFPNDPIFLRLLVYLIYALEIAQTLLLTDTVWKWLVSGFGMLTSLENIDVESWVGICTIGGIVAFLVQLFYAYRIRTLSRNLYMPSIITILAVFSYAGALGTSIYAAQLQTHDVSFSRSHETGVSAVIAIWLVGGSSCDILIALSMCYYLRKGVQDIHFRSTHRLVTRLIRMTLETGSFTASLSIVSMVLFFIPASILDWQVPMSITAKLYSTTLLAVLNSRMNLSFASDHTVSWDCEEPTPLSKSDMAFASQDRMKFESNAEKNTGGSSSSM